MLRTRFFHNVTALVMIYKCHAQHDLIYFRSKPEVQKFKKSYLKNHLSCCQNLNVTFKINKPAQTFAQT